MRCLDLQRIVLLSTVLLSLGLGGCEAWRPSPGAEQGRALYLQLIQRERDAVWHAAIAQEASLAQQATSATAPGDGILLSPGYQQVSQVAGWFVYCTTDRLYDRRSCLGIKDYLHIGWQGTGLAYVTIGQAGERAPKQPILLRIDADAPFITHSQGWSDTAAAQILNRLLQGQQAITRHRSWPADRVIEQATSLEGIREVWDSMQAWVQER